MKITKVVVGLLEENCYVLEKDKQVIVVDPGDEYERIKKVIGHKKVAGVLITHNHFDHVGALEEFDPSLVYKYDNLEEGEHTIGPFNFEVIYTPGHTKDSVSYYFKEDNILFDGDFVFCLGIGRCDLDDGDYKEMMRSIEKIKKYPKDMIIFIIIFVIDAYKYQIIFSIRIIYIWPTKFSSYSYSIIGIGIITNYLAHFICCFY